MRLRPAPGGAAAARLPGARRPRRAELAGRAGRAGRDRPLRAAAAPSGCAGAWAQIDHELEVIGEPRLRRATSSSSGTSWSSAGATDIYCQGRGSAANSAVCFALGITNADAVALGLLFERFLSPERDGPPDIDIDIESGRREEVIPYVYERYGRQHAAQVANVITYRARSAIRDMGKALGHAARGGRRAGRRRSTGASRSTERSDLPSHGRAGLAGEVLDFPRHLGLHSGGMVICDRPVIEVCPVEWARHARAHACCSGTRTTARRSAWSSSTCSASGMLEALHRTVDLIREPTASRSTWPCSPRRTPSTTCCAGPTPWGCSRWRAGPRWPRFPGSGRAASPTW